VEDEGKANAHDEPQEGEDPSPSEGETETNTETETKTETEKETEVEVEDHPEGERDGDGGDEDEAAPLDAPGIPARQDADIPDGKVARTTTTERTWDQDRTAEPDPERGAVSDARARERGLLEGHPEDRGTDESSEMEPDEG
jgi:hypothetical protein